MKPILIHTLFLCVLGSAMYAQADSVKEGLKFDVSANNYFMQDDFHVLPTLKIDVDWLHLEGRYNYEDLQTFSAWIGYNFTGGKKLGYTITPMAGGVFGLSNGIATGLEWQLTYGRFELYSESEYFADPADRANDFYYQWLDFSYSALDWLWLGLSAQRLRIYESDLEIEKGLLLGFGGDSWSVTAYAYSPHLDNRFFMFSIDVQF